MSAFAIGFRLGSLAVSGLDRFAFGRLSIAALPVSGVAWLGAVVAGWLPATVCLLYSPLFRLSPPTT